MCLAIPSKIIKIGDDNTAVVDTLGMRRRVSLDLMMDPVDVGDYVLIHVGYAMTKLDEEQALESIKAYEELIRLMEEDERDEFWDEVRGES